MNETPKFWVRLKLKIQYYIKKIDTCAVKCWNKLLPYVFLYLFLVIILQIYQKTDWVIQFNQVSYLQNRDGFVYEVNSDSKFTGRYVDFYGKETECTGVSCWGVKQQMREKIIYRDGVRNGGYTYWYLNGQKMREGSYKEGKKDGEWDQWY
jgi:hypothetical protein